MASSSSFMDQACIQSHPNRTALMKFFVDRPLQWFSLQELANKTGLENSVVVEAIQALQHNQVQMFYRPPDRYSYEPNEFRLNPDAICAQLPTQWWGKTIFAGEEIGSTIDMAKTLAGVGYGHGTVVLANAQTQGRGRGENRWLSPKGKDILLSFMIRSNGWRPPASLLSLYTTTVAARVLDTAYGLPVRIKWPNDLIYDGKKLGGILAEFHSESGHFILSMGLNVHSQPADWPQAIRERSVSLALVQQDEWCRETLIAQLGATWETLWENMMRDRGATVRGYWNRYSVSLEKTVSLIYRGEALNGFTRTIDENGNLIFTVEDGRLLHLTPEDVSQLRVLEPL